MGPAPEGCSALSVRGGGFGHLLGWLLFPNILLEGPVPYTSGVSAGEAGAGGPVPLAPAAPAKPVRGRFPSSLYGLVNTEIYLRRQRKHCPTARLHIPDLKSFSNSWGQS